MTLPDYKDDVKDDDGIADAPPVPSHSEAYGPTNKLTMAGGTRYLQSHSSASSPWPQQNTVMKKSMKQTQPT